MDKQIAKFETQQIQSAEAYVEACDALLEVMAERKQAEFVCSDYDEAYKRYKKALEDKKALVSPWEQAEKKLRALIAEYAASHDIVPEVKGITVSDDWAFEIEDASKIPQEYLVPDLKKIGKVVKALGDMANIPGVVVRKTAKITVRGRE